MSDKKSDLGKIFISARYNIYTDIPLLNIVEKLNEYNKTLDDVKDISIRHNHVNLETYDEESIQIELDYPDFGFDFKHPTEVIIYSGDNCEDNCEYSMLDTIKKFVKDVE